MAEENITEELRRELAFYFGAYHGTLEHRLDAASCMENDCVRIRNLLHAPALNIRQRAERAARKIADIFGLNHQRESLTNIIAAEFDNNQ